MCFLLVLVQFYDLCELFRTGGPVPDTNYIFMVRHDWLSRSVCLQLQVNPPVHLLVFFITFRKNFRPTRLDQNVKKNLVHVLKVSGSFGQTRTKQKTNTFSVSSSISGVCGSCSAGGFCGPGLL